MVFSYYRLSSRRDACSIASLSHGADRLAVACAFDLLMLNGDDLRRRPLSSAKRYRSSAGDTERSRKFAAELVALNPDLIVASGVVTVAPLLQITRTVPIVFVNVGDPVGAGSWTVWRDRAATLPVLRCSNIA